MPVRKKNGVQFIRLSPFSVAVRPDISVENEVPTQAEGGLEWATCATSHFLSKSIVQVPRP